MMRLKSERRIAMWAVTGAVIIASAMGCSQQRGGEQPVSTSLAMSYPTYDSLAALSQRSDLIIVGRVNSVTSELVEMAPAEQKDKLPDFKKSSTQVVMSSYEVFTSRALKGKSPRSLIVTQPGGSYAGQRIENEDEDELVQGREYLLFLLQVEGGYALVGGAQGAYVVDTTGRLTAHEAKSRDVRSKLHGRSLKAVQNDPAIRSVGSGRSGQRDDGPSEPRQTAPEEKLEASKPR